MSSSATLVDAEKDEACSRQRADSSLADGDQCAQASAQTVRSDAFLIFPISEFAWALGLRFFDALTYASRHPPAPAHVVRIGYTMATRSQSSSHR